MDFIISFSMAKKVKFHVKAIPWFISDVTENDFYWTLNQLSESGDANMKQLGLRWTGNGFFFFIISLEIFQNNNIIKQHLYMQIWKFSGDLLYGQNFIA